MRSREAALKALSAGRARSTGSQALRWVAGGALLGSGFFASPARAEPGTETERLEVRLDYIAPAGCPNLDAFERIVANRLGYYPFGSDASHGVLVRVEARAQNLSGQFEWRDVSGQWAGDQRFPARTADCDALVRTMALALAVQIHLLATVSEAPTSSVATPPPAEVPDTNAPPNPVRAGTAPKPSEPVVPPPPEPRDVSRWEFGAGGGVSLGEGLSSRVVGSGRIFGLMVRRRLSFELAGEVALPTTTRRSDGAGYSQELMLGSLAACGAHPPWSACVVGKSGVVRVRGRDIDVPASKSGAIVQTGLRAALSSALASRAFVAARLEGLATLTRWTVRLDDLEVWAAPRFSASVGFDLGVLLP
jgi:hypothetical protein